MATQPLLSEINKTCLAFELRVQNLCKFHKFEISSFLNLFWCKKKIFTSYPKSKVLFKLFNHQHRESQWYSKYRVILIFLQWFIFFLCQNRQIIVKCSISSHERNRWWQKLLYVPLDYNILVKLYMDSIITYAGLSFVNKALVMLFVDISVWLYTAKVSF